MSNMRIFNRLEITCPNAYRVAFDAHIIELCRKVNQKVHAFGRLRPFLGEQKAKLLFNFQFFMLPSNLAIL